MHCDVIHICAYTYEEGPKRPDLSPGGQAPCSTQASHTRWVFQEPICISALAGVVVRNCFQPQWICFEDSFNMLAHSMMNDLQVHLSTPCWMFSSFRPKTTRPQYPTPIHPISPHDFLLLLFTWMKISSQGSILPMWKRWNKKWQKH